MERLMVAPPRLVQHRSGTAPTRARMTWNASQLGRAAQAALTSLRKSIPSPYSLYTSADWLLRAVPMTTTVSSRQFSEAEQRGVHAPVVADCLPRIPSGTTTSIPQ